MKLNVPKLPWLPRLMSAHRYAEVFLVGGMVRDLFLRRDSKDIDLIMRGIPMPKLIATLRKLGRVNFVGKTFGVLKFTYKNQPSIDIALPRTDHAGGSGAHRDVKTIFSHILPIESDLSRRDFTINAIAYDLSTNALIDPHHGVIDIRNKIIRAVGEPKDRFQEDYIRVLRALRFACQLDFAIEPNTWRAIKKFTPLLNDLNEINERKVTYELVGREFIKSLVSNPSRFMELWDTSGAFKTIAHELLKMHKCPQPKNYHTEGDVWKHTMLALSNLHGKGYKKFTARLPKIYRAPQKPTALAYTAVLLHDVAKPITIQTPQKDGVDRIRFSEHDVIGGRIATEMAERLRFSSVENHHIDINSLRNLVAHHLIAVQAPIANMKETTIEKYFLRDLEFGRELLTLMYADGSATLPKNKKAKLNHLNEMLTRVNRLLKTRGKKQTVLKPLVNGDDIMVEFKLAPGPKIGELLKIAREAQLTGRVKTKKQTIRLLSRVYSK